MSVERSRYTESLTELRKLQSQPSAQTVKLKLSDDPQKLELPPLTVLFNSASTIETLSAPETLPFSFYQGFESHSFDLHLLVNLDMDFIQSLLGTKPSQAPVQDDGMFSSMHAQLQISSERIMLTVSQLSATMRRQQQLHLYPFLPRLQTLRRPNLPPSQALEVDRLSTRNGIEYGNGLLLMTLSSK